MTNESIIEKIRKLMAMARDSGASENEQQVALEKAQALMLKYGIKEVPDKKAEVTKGNWITELDQKFHRIVGSAVGKLYGTEVVVKGGETSTFMFIGRTENIQASELTLNMLCDQIEIFYKAHLPKGLTKSERAKWRKDYKVSAAFQIKSRIQDLIKRLSQDDKSAEEVTGCKAVVIRNHYLTLVDEITKFKESQNYSKTGGLKSPSKITDAVIAGKVAGNSVKIHQEISKDLPKQITKA